MSNSHRELKTADDKSVSKCDKRAWMEQSRRGRVRNWLQIAGNVRKKPSEDTHCL